MIIKKFQIPCPLTLDDAINGTVVTVLNSTLDQLDSKAVAYSEDACTPKYFVFNSQVRLTLPATRPESLLISEVEIMTRFSTHPPRLSTPFPSSPSPSCATPPSCPCTRSSKSECLPLLVSAPLFELKKPLFCRKQSQMSHLNTLSSCFKQSLPQEDAGRRQRLLPCHVPHVPAGCPLWISDL